MTTRTRLVANQIHITATFSTDYGTAWAWYCEDCPASAGDYATEADAKRIAAIHEDPSRLPIKHAHH